MSCPHGCDECYGPDGACVKCKKDWIKSQTGKKLFKGFKLILNFNFYQSFYQFIILYCSINLSFSIVLSIFTSVFQSIFLPGVHQYKGECLPPESAECQLGMYSGLPPVLPVIQPV